MARPVNKEGVLAPPLGLHSPKVVNAVSPFTVDHVKELQVEHSTVALQLVVVMKGVLAGIRAVFLALHHVTERHLERVVAALQVNKCVIKVGGHIRPQRTGLEDGLEQQDILCIEGVYNRYCRARRVKGHNYAHGCWVAADG